MVLKLNGKSLDLTPECPAVVAIKKFLDKAPADELFTRDEVAKKIGLTPLYLRDLGSREELAKYCCMLRNRKLWGNPKAIAELRKQVGK